MRYTAEMAEAEQTLFQELLNTSGWDMSDDMLDSIQTAQRAIDAHVEAAKAAHERAINVLDRKEAVIYVRPTVSSVQRNLEHFARVTRKEPVFKEYPQPDPDIFRECYDLLVA